MDDVRDDDILDRGRRILRSAGEAVLRVADGLDAAFVRAVLIVESCTGSVVVTGIGKAGLVARKISATLASTGAPRPDGGSGSASQSRRAWPRSSGPRGPPCRCP